MLLPLSPYPEELPNLLRFGTHGLKNNSRKGLDLLAFEEVVQIEIF